MKTKILIVEDSPTQAESLRNNLELSDYEVVWACDGSKGLSYAKTYKPSAIITDVQMPIMDGWEMCKSLKKDPILKNIPVIMLTSLEDNHSHIRSLACGSVRFFRKPYDFNALLLQLKFVLNFHKNK